MQKPKNQPGRWKLIFPLCLVLSASVFPTLILYARNVNMIAFRFALPFFAGFAALGGLAYLVAWLTLRQSGKAALLTAWLMAVFCNFGLLGKLLPSLYTSRVTYLVCGLVCVAVSVVVWYVLRRAKQENAEVLCMVFAAVFTFLVAFNAVTCAATGVRQRANREAQLQTPGAAAIEEAAKNATKPDRPNFYLLLFDEYAGFDQLADYYAYDNSTFHDYLTDSGFTVSHGSTNEMIDTMFVLSDLLNLQYLHPKGYQEDVLRHQISNGVLFDVMETLGYTLYDTEGDALTELQNPIPDLHASAVPTTQSGETHIKVFLNNTAAFFLYDNVERMILAQRTLHPDAVNLVMDYYATADLPKGPAFYFGYICSPHGAFFFDADGNRIDTLDDPYGNFNWTDKSVYLGQLEYVNKLIQRAVDNILAQDPDSIIIVMSDHGARNHGEFYGNADVTLAQSLDILMAVYNRGQPLEEIQGQTGVNILRLLLSETYGMDLEPLEFWDDPHHAPQTAYANEPYTGGSMGGSMGGPGGGSKGEPGGGSVGGPGGEPGGGSKGGPENGPLEEP